MNTRAIAKLLKIGEVAAGTGLPVKTIRYYDEIGLLAPTVERSDSGYRLFNEAIMNRLAFIKRAQSLGLSLSEIQELLSVHDGGALPCGEVKHRLQTKLEEIAEQIAALEMLKAELQGLLSGWEEQPPAHLIAQTICPNIQSNNDE
ncbi:heavy metal-responsive transcriptional regulator [Microcoleus sp. FACHB-672]|uniref:heavy metal-responsive transcriptional regulator n=1 Tax=Microcoleus sp. FACHB-672 TaxID=2692825 RepID=UPI001682C5B6|nr:heavy metal-responsive transcriptional regulator [Microcoleus sp. FACHB-672]MBD2041924.1 heavy metal-responsive transcriptional regulator [Microcoleus sp. FACHB-672]